MMRFSEITRDPNRTESELRIQAFMVKYLLQTKVVVFENEDTGKIFIRIEKGKKNEGAACIKYRKILRS